MKLLLFSSLGWQVFEVGSRKFGFLKLSPIAVLYKYQCMGACTENIQSILLGFWWFFLGLEWFTGQPIHPLHLVLQVRIERHLPWGCTILLWAPHPWPWPALMPVMGRSWGVLVHHHWLCLSLLECGNRKRQIPSLEEKLLLLMKLSVIPLKGYLAHVFTKYLFATVAALKLRKGALCCHLSVNWEERELYLQTFGPIYLSTFFLKCISSHFLRNQLKFGESEKLSSVILVLCWRKSEWYLNITCFGITTTEPQSCMGQ